MVCKIYLIEKVIFIAEGKSAKLDGTSGKGADFGKENITFASWIRRLVYPSHQPLLQLTHWLMN